MIAEWTGLTASGSLTAVDQAGTIAQLYGCGTVAVDLAGTFTATITFEAQLDGGTWRSVAATPAAGGAQSTTATAAGLFVVPVAGYKAFRARCSAYTSGTASVLLHATIGDSGLATGGAAGAAGGGVSQGTFTDRSGSVTAGGTRQQLAAANTSRKSFIFQNISTAVLYLNFGANATNNSGTPDSFEVQPGDGFDLISFCTTQAVDVLGATTGQKWVAKEGA